jgi:alpha-glucuronidase
MQGRCGSARGRLACVVVVLLAAITMRAETGHDLWLRYQLVENATLRDSYRHILKHIRLPADSGTSSVLREEVMRSARGMLDLTPKFVSADDDGITLFIGTTQETGLPREFIAGLDPAGPEGYVVRSIERAGRPVVVIAANSGTGALYGFFRLLRELQLRRPVDRLNLHETPAIRRRLLNHWDNLDGSIERGYAGSSVWKWDELPGKLDARYTDYARANASIGINGAVLNNVNAEARILTQEYLQKVAAIAGTLRPYGIRVYLSANFGAPLRAKPGASDKKGGEGIGNLDTADPLDPQVRQWWKDKASEIYRLIPDFGGFLVKANSEGMPGPNDYGRSHADGANMLAEALAPHDGVVLWRAFVYPKNADPDRAKRSFLEFVPLEGKFTPNTFIQVKNGTLDFQPHEPFHPMFGAMPRTPLALEVQITQEYIGESTHLVYLGPQWKNLLDVATGAPGINPTLARIVAGQVDGHSDSAIAGVANVGSDPNWCGHEFAAANWYAFGRLAWDPSLAADAIAREWVAQTWTTAPGVVDQITTMMMASWPAAVNYLSPLGLSFTMDGKHYDPGLKRRDGQYWRSDRTGIGYDRSSRGSNYVGQYHESIRAVWDDPRTCPLDDLLFFHFVAWSQPLSTGRSLWEELCFRYRDGVRVVEKNIALWQSLAGSIDAERHARVAEKLTAQLAHARRWRDESISYFQSRNGLPVPPEPSVATGN